MMSTEEYYDPELQSQQQANRPPVTKRNRELAAFGHLVGVFFGVFFLVPTFIWLFKSGASPFVKRHSKEAINFQLNFLFWLAVTVVIVYYAGFIVQDYFPQTVPYVRYFFILPVLSILYGAFFALRAGYMANESEEYRYPLLIFRLFS